MGSNKNFVVLVVQVLATISGALKGGDDFMFGIFLKIL